MAKRSQVVARPTLVPPFCNGCRFFKAYDEVMPGPKGLGICRRFPPTPTKHGTSWPVTRAADWCGEFTAGSR